MKGNYINLITVFAVGIAILMGCKSDEEKRLDAEKLERPAKFGAARADFSRKPAKIALVQQPYLKGKVVVLSSLNGGEFGYQAVRELSNLEAATPEEVGTVVLKECKSVQRGVYRTNENPPRELPAIAVDCQMNLIDRANSTVYFVKNFVTEPIKDARVGELSNDITSTPTLEMNAFLKSLPQK